MKITKKAAAVKSAVAVLTALAIVALIGCASKPKVKIVEMENKGTSMGIKTPSWVTTYVEYGVARVQASSDFRNKYVVIGEESGVNRQFVVTWADNFSAQQRIGAMLRTTIASEYQARIDAEAATRGGAVVSEGSSSGDFAQFIDSVVNSIITVSYSGAQREADWWSLRRRYDPDAKEVFNDEYTAYVLYTIPKGELNRQVAEKLQENAKAGSELYQITIDMARQILQNGLAQWGAE